MNKKHPSYYLISSAMDGDENAIVKLLNFYEPYISKCCLRPPFMTNTAMSMSLLIWS